MASQEHRVGAAAAKPSHRRGHQPSSSLGSLYEVLADLDDTQLQYLIQEMNHTGHRNVPVLQAVTALESQNPPGSLTNLEASMRMPAPQEPQRRLSKSQRGKLRLQTAFQKSPVLKERQQRQEAYDAGDGPERGVGMGTPTKAQKHQPVKYQIESPESSDCFTASFGDIHSELSQEPETWSDRREDTAEVIAVQIPTSTARRDPPAYRRISRPDFSLPAGVTVTDLLELLKSEYLSSDLQPSSSRSSSSSASPTSTSSPAFPTNLFPPPSRPFAQRPNWPGQRPLRRHSSRLDMALDVERSASGTMEIGLGMLEPRQPRSVSLGGAPGSRLTTVSLDSYHRNLRGETPPPVSSMVFEGIFDVLENQ
ncbi:hypothetical protein EsH8_VII_000154 [Colletotrichum jinshuiense]